MQHLKRKKDTRTIYFTFPCPLELLRPTEAEATFKNQRTKNNKKLLTHPDVYSQVMLTFKIKVSRSDFFKILATLFKYTIDCGEYTYL